MAVVAQPLIGFHQADKLPISAKRESVDADELSHNSRAVEALSLREKADVVIADRYDILIGGGFEARLRVEGTFRIRDGKISEWSDRFAWLPLFTALGRSLPNIASHWARRLTAS